MWFVSRTLILAYLMILFKPDVTDGNLILFMGRNYEDSFPDCDVHLFFQEFYVDFHNKPCYDEAEIRFPSELTSASDKRQTEFLAGRSAAKRALEFLGQPPADILISENRSPLWPKNIMVSLSYNNSVAVCAVSQSPACRFLGVDIEETMSDDITSKISSSVVGGREKEILDSLSMSANLALTIAFSAKESLFKALSFKVGRLFGFEDVLISSFSIRDNSITFELLNHIVKKAKLQRKLRCLFRIGKDFVITLVADTQVALNHRWL